MTNMRAYKDGKRLVIVLEDAGQAMEDCIMSLLSGNAIAPVEHLGTPPPMERKKVDIRSMSEIKPTAVKNTTSAADATAVTISPLPADGNIAPVATTATTTTIATAVSETETKRVEKPLTATLETDNSTAEDNHGSGRSVNQEMRSRYQSQQSQQKVQTPQPQQQPSLPKKQLPKFIQNAQEGIPSQGQQSQRQTQKQPMPLQPKNQGVMEHREAEATAVATATAADEKNSEKRHSQGSAKVENTERGFLTFEDVQGIPVEGTLKNMDEKMDTNISRNVSGDVDGDTNQKTDMAARTSLGRSDIMVMNVFRIREFLDGKRSDEKLRALLMKKHHTSDLDFVLGVKSERELREIAVELIGLTG